MVGTNHFAGAVPIGGRKPEAKGEFDPKQGVIELSKLTMAVWGELKELIEVLGGQAADVHRIANAMTGDEGLPHMPAIAPMHEGAWGVFCLACSRDAGEYVYPCTKRPDDPEAPPARLVAAPEFVETLPKEG